MQLVNASTAAHWFDLAAFFQETDRVLCSNGVIALSCYGIASHVFVHAKADELLEAFRHVGNSLFDLFYFHIKIISMFC